jgi:hypothetical protein
LFKTTRAKFKTANIWEKLDGQNPNIDDLYKAVATEHKRAYNDKYFKLSPPRVEVMEYIKENKPLEDNARFINNVIMIQDPYNEEEFMNTLENRRYAYNRFDTGADESPEEPVRICYINKLKSFEYIDKKLDKIVKNERKPFNIRFSLGFILERRIEQESGEINFEYLEVSPHHNDNNTGKERTIKTSIRDQSTMNYFKQYIRSYISSI